MYTYKVLEAKHPKAAEELMNKMAKDGWKVISTTYWMNFNVRIIITFEREA